MTQQADPILIRSCQGRDEFEACVQLQIDTWGYDPADLIPNRSFLLSQKIGGQVIGAFDTALPGASEQGNSGQGDAASLVGYAYAVPGIKPKSEGPEGYLHSHMLAVKSTHRNRGLGAKLKLFQRQEALSRGIRHMEWTFDPLEIKNAFLNIHKLGAVIRRYYPDFYGVSSSRLQGGLPTDRLVAEWYLDSPRVNALTEGKADAEYKIEERITVPASIYQWKASDKDRERAAAVQLENRGRFQQAFAQGLAVVGFERDAEENGIYQLAQFAAVETGIQSV
jgi:predicted GNAT superfamily acetyltransferase